MASMAVSPNKGKGRESTRTTWEAGWWDVFPLTEAPKRNLQWSASSVMFMASPTQPIVIARHFSSSKQFMLPSCNPITAAPASYRPPVCVLVSSSEDHVFAFFPGRDTDGIGCIWRHGFATDVWAVQKWWLFPLGAGVVSGRWLGSPRQWAFGESEPIRLPPQGPRVPSADAVLLLITEDHYAHLSYSRQYSDFKTVKVTLLHPNTTEEDQIPMLDCPNSDRVCFDVAIGVHFSETRIFIAHRSRCVSLPDINPEGFDLNLNLGNLPQSRSVTDWEVPGEDPRINICTLDINTKNSSVVMSASPLSPILKVPRHVTQMCFMSYPQSDRTAASNDDTPRHREENLFLCVSLLEMGDFDTSPVTSSLDLYRFSRSPVMDGPSTISTWTYSHCKNASFDGALAFVIPSIQNGTISEGVAFIGVLDVPSKASKSQSRDNQTSVGSMRVINIPGLTENPRWESTPIWSSVYVHGLPHAGEISPNQQQIWTPSFSLWNYQSSLQLLPQPHQGDNQYQPMAISILLAILSRRTVVDIVHLLCKPTVLLQEVVATLTQTLLLLQSIPTGSRFPLICELVGIALELYKTRGDATRDEREKVDMKARWQTAQEVTSLAACRVAFEDCSEGYKYDPTAMWQLTKLCNWTLEFIKKLMKECVLVSTQAARPLTWEGDGDDPFNTSSVQDSSWAKEPILLHLSHPFALENLTVLLIHLKRFRNFIETLQAPEDDQWKIARSVLFDSIDYCPVNLEELDTFLLATWKESQKLPENVQNEALMACKPINALIPNLQAVIQKISNKPTLLDKARLFIEQSDLLDGVSRVSVSNQSKGKGLDIVTKDVLKKKPFSLLCLRCGGQYDRLNLGMQQAGSFRWKIWEKRWMTRCICGGSWSRAAPW